MSPTLFSLTFNCICSSPKKYAFFLVAILFVSSNLAHAKESVPDKFKIALGGYSVFRYDSAMSLTEPDIGAGILISPEDTLGLNNEQTVLQLTGHYRFTKKHALTYSWYRISSQANKTLAEDFEWLDKDDNPITIPVGVTIDSSLDLNIFKVGYLWSFYHSDKVELAVGAGLHLTRITIDLNVDQINSGIETEDVAVTMPLPVASLRLSYAVTPKLSWTIKSEVFSLKYEDWDGLYTDVSLAMEYRAFENLSLGIGLASSSLGITEETSDYNFSFDNRITGVLIYTAAYF